MGVWKGLGIMGRFHLAHIPIFPRIPRLGKSIPALGRLGSCSRNRIGPQPMRRLWKDGSLREISDFGDGGFHKLGSPEQCQADAQHFRFLVVAQQTFAVAIEILQV